MKNKKALSNVIGMVIMIALVIAAIVLVWNVVNNLISEELESSTSCLNVFGKIELNNYYTCYDNSNNEFRFSINMKDVEVDEIIVSISGVGETKSYILTNNSQTITGLKYLNGTTTVKVPSQNSGKTYITTEFSSKPDMIAIIPVVNGNQCDTSDSLNEIVFCSS